MPHHKTSYGHAPLTLSLPHPVRTGSRDPARPLAHNNAKYQIILPVRPAGPHPVQTGSSLPYW
jgi:hypothetical protein